MRDAATGTDELVEDLADLAPYAFRIAEKSCRACCNYHATWSYERLAGVRGNGFESERDFVGDLFREYVPQKGRILIGGAADAGLLAFAAQETHSCEARITVVDRCPTPLAVSRRYAESCELKIATAEVDLTVAPPRSVHDLAFVHNLLVHIPFSLWAAFLRNILRALEPGGVLLLVHRGHPSGEWPEQRESPEAYAARAIEALVARNIALPEAEDLFRRRLAQRSGGLWRDRAVGTEELETSLNEAGFVIERHIDHDRRRARVNLGGEAKPVITHIFLATNASGRSH